MRSRAGTTCGIWIWDLGARPYLGPFSIPSTWFICSPRGLFAGGRPAGLRPITRSVDWVEVGWSQTIRERSENACFAAQMKRTVEPGEVDVLVGANSTEASAVQVTVVP